MPTTTPLHQCQCFNTSCCDCFVNGLKRDRARGQLAPHQLILLLSLLTYINKQDNRIFESEYAVIFKCTLLPKLLNIFLNHNHETLQDYFEARIDC